MIKEEMNSMSSSKKLITIKKKLYIMKIDKKIEECPACKYTTKQNWRLAQHIIDKHPEIIDYITEDKEVILKEIPGIIDIHQEQITTGSTEIQYNEEGIPSYTTNHPELNIKDAKTTEEVNDILNSIPDKLSKEELYKTQMDRIVKRFKMNGSVAIKDRPIIEELYQEYFNAKPQWSSSCKHRNIHIVQSTIMRYLKRS